MFGSVTPKGPNSLLKPYHPDFPFHFTPAIIRLNPISFSSHCLKPMYVPLGTLHLYSATFTASSTFILNLVSTSSLLSLRLCISRPGSRPLFSLLSHGGFQITSSSSFEDNSYFKGDTMPNISLLIYNYSHFVAWTIQLFHPSLTCNVLIQGCLKFIICKTLSKWHTVSSQWVLSLPSSSFFPACSVQLVIPGEKSYNWNYRWCFFNSQLQPSNWPSSLSSNWYCSL